MANDSPEAPKTCYDNLFGEPALESSEAGEDDVNPGGDGALPFDQDSGGGSGGDDSGGGGFGGGDGSGDSGGSGRDWYQKILNHFGQHIAHAAVDHWVFYLKLRDGPVLRFSHAEPNFGANTLCLHEVQFVEPRPEYAVSEPSGQMAESLKSDRSGLAIGANERDMTVRWEEVLWVCEASS